MIKYLIVLFGSLSFAFLNLFDIQDVEITHNIPDYLVSGKTYDIDIIIKKGDIQGFAKFQMDVPDGINVKAVETGGSSFTFKSNVVKNIWMKVPEESEIILSYKFEVAANMAGSGTVDGRFVFIKDNERFSVEMPKHDVKIGDESGMTSTAASAAVPAFNPDDIKLTRTVKSLANNEFEITVTIEKDGLEGFAKVQDELPEGFEARPMRTSMSVFSVVENKVKFIWFNIPPEETIVVSYLLSSRFPVTEETVLKGSFNFLYNDEARQIDLPPEKLINFVDNTIEVSVTGEEPAGEVAESKENAIAEPEPQNVAVPAVTTGGVAAAAAEEKEELNAEDEETVAEAEKLIEEEAETPEQKTAVQETVVVEEPVVEKKADEEEIRVEEPVVEEKVVVEEITSVPEPSGDIFYRLQLVAGHRNVKTDYLKKKYKFQDVIYLENHEGWYKYTTGNYKVYVDARNRREAIKQNHNFPGPFVTAYNAGERITVQEALLITKQKWVK